MRLVLAACAVLLISCGARTAETAPAPVAKPAESASGVRAYVDPATGKLRQPTEEELKAATPPVQPTVVGPAPIPAPLPQTVRPDGTVIMELGPAQMNDLCAHTTKDGVVEEHCPPGQQAK